MAQDLYRNRDFIPDFDALMAEIAARSHEFAAGVTVQADVAYGREPRARMDILLPPTLRNGAPVHMFIHGGYWRSGNKADHHLVAVPVHAVGGVAVIVGYGLLPATRLGPVVAQIRRAAQHVLAIAPTLGADPARFTVSGHSAGAHLASYLAAHGPKDPPAPEFPAVRAILMVSGIYDLSDIPSSFLKDEAGMTAQEAKDWSPLTAAQRPGPSRTITRGAQETAPFHDQARAFASLLDHNGQPCTLHEEPGLNHLSILLALADPTSRLGGDLAAMISGS
ncbi:MAG: alpha/beta hydrolase [Pseudotabrizicola sp.]|uniref:alpha/beta hydrolase n=1 Tax=Pseudotabrizicola sp. TaxID=2939647 RepID=UPI0027241A5E|nr:alpha/beta hydrolase [Pseudotabrizicola sp.]MDO9638274.1 alpha/beta hydrolase [Pseudotabrizicola sp.]